MEIYHSDCPHPVFLFLHIKWHTCLQTSYMHIVVGLKYNCSIVIASRARFFVKLETCVLFVTFSFAAVYIGCVFFLYASVCMTMPCVILFDKNFRTLLLFQITKDKLSNTTRVSTSLSFLVYSANITSLLTLKMGTDYSRRLFSMFISKRFTYDVQ